MSILFWNNCNNNVAVFCVCYPRWRTDGAAFYIIIFMCYTKSCNTSFVASTPFRPTNTQDSTLYYTVRKG